MTHQKLCKAVEQGAVTENQLELINQYTRRALTLEEVFVFSIILCDNEIDRDLERFPTESLEKLGDLFLGMTGVFDHTPKAENQSARIFEARLDVSGEVNSLGEPYCCLKAWAYMVRCDKNNDLILEIDAGIKKEVSVGCAVESILCSVCHQDQKTGSCNHQKGSVYDGQMCHHLLINPTDAYEWSFVAVPAQKKAGVVKRHGAADADSVTVTKARLERLEQLAQVGKRYEAELRQSVVKLGLLGQTSLSSELLEGITTRLDIPQLEALQKSFGEAARKRYPLTPQLAPLTDGTQNKPDSKFQI